MYLKLNFEQLEKIKKVTEITSTDYELYGDFLPAESIMSIVEDLLCEIDNLKEQYDDLEQDLLSNYKPIETLSLYDINE